MKKFAPLLLCLLLASCATKIVRWPDKSPEKGSRTLAASENPDIFADFLWTTPPLTSRKIAENFRYAGREYSFRIEEGALLLSREGRTERFERQRSEGEIYPSTDYLEPATRTVYKWVPETRTVMESVPVSKTRSVPYTTTGMNGMMTTSYRTEFYTEIEHRFVTKTEWVWRSQVEHWYRVPSFDYYRIEREGELPFLIYEIDGETYLQNPGYLLCRETNKSFWGEKEINLLFIDTNADGNFLDPEDHMLFHSWNPYDPRSRHREISRLMDNKWYYTDALEQDLFLSFRLSDGGVALSYLNEAYIDNEEWGSLTVGGIEGLKPDIFLNGKEYNLKNDKPAAIQYGRFHMRIQLKKHLDYHCSFTVDEETPQVHIDYRETPPASLLKIRGIYSDNYFVTVTNSEGSRNYYKADEINIPLGENTVAISVNGFVLTRTIDTDSPRTVNIYFEEEIQKEEE